MDELTKIAMVGTSKHAGPLPAADHPAEALVLGRADGDREQSLLLRFGARTVYNLAGRQAVLGIEPIAPAPPETNKMASGRLAGLLQTVVVGGSRDLLIDCLQQMRERMVLLPHELLPLLLQSKVAGKCLIPILGERGKWLCRQNPDWSHFLTSDARQTAIDLEALKQTWDEGTIDERCQAIETLRRHDPLTARDWVARACANEKANHRVKLVESLETGLCGDDEVFLESCLNDRSSVVGQAAARLLCRLPQSALAGRMRARAAAILGIERTGLIVKKNKLVCTPPHEIDHACERDGISKRAPAGLGERAFWTERVLAAVPPSFWQSQFGLEPPALIAAVADDPFAGSVVAAWAEAAIAFAASDPASAGWYTPLWRHWAGAFGAVPKEARLKALLKMEALLPGMTSEIAEAAVTGLFEPPPGWEDADVLSCVMALPPPWSARFSAAFLAYARKHVQSRVSEASCRWATALAVQACSIPAEVFPLALAPWELSAPEPPTPGFAVHIQNEIDKFIATIETRQSFMTELDALMSSHFLGAQP